MFDLLISLYFVVMLTIAFWCRKNADKPKYYFLNDQNTGLWMMALSTTATLYGAGAYVATMTELYNTGISFAFAIFVANITGLTLFGLIAKRVRHAASQNGILSFADYITHRFGTKTGTLFGFAQIFILMIWSTIQAVAMATLMRTLFDAQYDIALLIASIITIFYTSIGGIKTDIISDVFQLFIILIVLGAMAFLAYAALGGVTPIFTQLPEKHWDVTSYGGAIFIVGAILASGFTLLGNAAYWQRVFTAKDEKVASQSFYMSIPLVVLLSVLTAFLGLASVLLLPNADKALVPYQLITHLLPDWLAAFGVIALLSIIITTINSLMIAGGATLSSMIKPYQKNIGKHGRLLSAAFGAVAYAIALFFPHIVELTVFIASLTLCLVPAILSGLLSKTKSGEAAFYSIAISLLVLIGLYPILGKNTFIVCAIVATIIMMFYDKLAHLKRRRA